MMANVIRQQATTNNLVNISTPGYKEDAPVAEAYPQMAILDPAGTSRFPAIPWSSSIGDLNTATVISGVQTNLAQGPLRQTGNALDLALSGEAFFAIQGPDGATYYTRNGSFVKDALNRLCTADGNLVLGENGPIQLPEGDISVMEDGTVVVGGTMAGKIRVVTFPDGTVVQKMGNTLFSTVGDVQPVAAVDHIVLQGYLEGSNVDEVRAMVEMMSALRSYETQQRIISMQNQTLGLAVNELGKV